MNSLLAISTCIHQNAEWFGVEAVRKAEESLRAHEAREYRAAVLAAGACLEGLLQRTLRDWQVDIESVPTLGYLAGLVRRSGRVPDAVLERLQEGILIRNRAAHDKGTRWANVTEGDSLLVVTILGLVVDWCREQQGSGGVTSRSVDLLPVFLSVGGPHRLDQQQFLHRLASEMQGLGVQLLSLAPGTYSKEKPFDQIRGLLITCRGALIVGLERSHAYAVFERERSEEERVHQDQYTPTAWNQIEGSMAAALQLPLLILRDQRLHREGIFEASNHGHRIHDFNLTAECRGPSPELLGLLRGWVEHLHTFRCHVELPPPSDPKHIPPRL